MRARTSLATLAALLLAVLLAAGRQATAEQLLTNGDFSQGSSGWTPQSLGFDTDCDGHTANPAARLYLDGSDEGRLESAAIPIEPGATYEASGYARFAAGAEPSPKLRLILVFYRELEGRGELEPEVLSALLPVDATDYTFITTGPQAAPDGARSARLLVTLGATGVASACVDDLSLEGPRPSPTKTPTPTTPTPSPTPTLPPTSTVGPTATATEVPMPSGSILNGGFEEGVEDIPAAWQKFGGFLSRSGAFPRSGSFAGVFSSSTDSTKWVYQSVSVEPGRSYAFHGFVLKNGPADSIVVLRISWYSSPDASGSSVASSDSPESLSGSDASFRYLSTGSVTAPGEARSARARIVLVPASAAPETIYLDDFALEETAPPTPTPEPTATATPTPSETVTPTPASPEPASLAAAMPRGRVLNGGFEEGVEDTPAAWQKFGGLLCRSGAFPRSGFFAGAFSSSTDSSKWVYQSLSVDPGRSYAFHGFVLKNGPPGSIVLLRISWYSSPDASGSSVASSDSPESLSGSDASFRYLSTGSVTAPGEARSARARIVLVPASAAPETIYLDDFALEETAPPTPASGGESQEAPLAGQASAVGGPEPSTGPSVESGAESDGGTRSPGRVSAASTPEGRDGRTHEDSPYAVKISEVLADAGAGGGDAASEWVELYNAGLESVELGGWSLADNVAADTLPPEALPPGAYAVVAASPDLQRQYPAFQGTLVVLVDGRIGNGLANEGDRLLLLDEEGRPVDALSYGVDREFFDPPAPAVAAGHSLERFPADRDTDTAADFRDNAHPSPGSGPMVMPSPTPTATPLSEVQSQALSVAGGNSGFSWPWLLLAAGLVFVGGTGAGVAGVLFWLARGRSS
jgi:hypothetical protein